MNKSIINSIIGKSIQEIRAMSFYINCKQVCEIIVLYIRIDDDKWIKITTSDGHNVIELLANEPKEVQLDEIEDEFAYPIKSINTCYINKHIKELKEYIYKNQSDELNGFYLEFTDGSGFSIIEKDDCLILLDGIWLDDNYSLIPFSK